MILRGMKIYTVHIKPDMLHAIEKPEFVREGFNIFAFLFSGLWALSQKLWWQAALLIGLYVLMGLLASRGFIQLETSALANLGIQLIAGLQGNDWVRARLSRSGYVLADIAVADTALRAQQRYFERHMHVAL